MNRLLKSEELRHGLFVQCGGLSNIIYPGIYQILIRDGKYFYKAVGSDWEMSADFVTDIWYETPETKSLMRSSRINELLGI